MCQTAVCSTSTGLCSTQNAADNSSCGTALRTTCQTGACQCYQGVSPASCTSGQSCLNWGFESGTAEGWGPDPTLPGVGVTNITVSTSHFHTGTRSLAVSIGIAAFSLNDSRGASVTVPLCASTDTVNLAGYTMSAWVLFTVSQGSVPMNAANLVQGFTLTPDLMSASQANTAVPVQQSTLNQWLHFQGIINQGTTLNALAGISVEFPIANPASEGLAGTMYIDDVQLIPP